MLGLPARLALGPGVLHGRVGEPRQHGVFGHRDDVVEPRRGVQEVEQLRRGKAPVEADEEPRRREGQAQQREQPAQHAAGPAGGRRVARPQQGRAEILLGFVVEGEKREQGQVTPAVIVPVEEGELLGAMGRVIGGVEIDRDPAGPPAEPPVMPLDHARRQVAPHRVELLDPDVVFKPRDRRLRREGVARHRVTTEQQLVNGVVGEAVGIVGIGMAARDAEDPLGEQVPQRVPDLPGLPVINQTPGDPIDHVVARLRRLEQDGAAIGARVRVFV